MKFYIDADNKIVIIYPLANDGIEGEIILNWLFELYELQTFSVFSCCKTLKFYQGGKGASYLSACSESSYSWIGDGVWSPVVW